MNIPIEIKEKILVAGEHYEKAWMAECEVREWLKQVGLAKDVEETPIDEAFVDYVRLGDGGTAEDFIRILETLKSEDPIDWESNEPAMVCGFTVDENREGQVWVELQWSMRRMDDAPNSEFAWKLIEIPICQRFLLGHDDLCWLAEAECWEGHAEKDCAEYLSSEEAAEYLVSSCSDGRLNPAEVGYSTPCGSYFFEI